MKRYFFGGVLIGIIITNAVVAIRAEIYNPPAHQTIQKSTCPDQIFGRQITLAAFPHVPKGTSYPLYLFIRGKGGSVVRCYENEEDAP